MARFINTKRAVSELEELIRNAGEKLYLVSPYLKLSKDFKELLAYRNSKNKVTTVIFGKQELKPDELNFLQGLRFIVLYYHEDLHAKCYANDDKMIITSLNLYEFSMANNKEMGVLIDRNDPADKKTFDDAMDEVKFIIDNSKPHELIAEKINGSERVREQSAHQKAADKPAAAPTKQSATGYCIRTGVEIPFNIEKPFCYEAYKSWRQFENGDYPEKYCHFSGEPSNGETCFNKPILTKNWKKAQQLHGC
ncbi:phospholipase D family protein [Candidatus Electronema sp. JM]|uniref:phospholipase D family protein n=1 Tax=Candidatus Electronema sp. JM TaxID=3401571 RepID=UPI003AA89B11